MDTTKIKFISDITDMTYEQMRIEFMRFSPTYQMLNQWGGAPINTSADYLKAMQAAWPTNKKRAVIELEWSELSQRQKKFLENNFEDAEFAYSQYGNIDMPYERWWKQQGHLIFDSPTNKALITDLGTVDTNNLDKTCKQVSANLVKLDDSVGSRFQLVLGVPMYSTHKEAMSQISKFLKDNLLAHADQPRLRKQLHGKRHRNQPLLKKLKLLMYKSMYPDESLIDIGIRANISPSNERILNNESFSSEEKTVARRRIGLAASRALMAAEFIAERAARDQFPDPRRTHSLGFNWEYSRRSLLKAWPSLQG